jgi:hypothetical protein
MLDSNKSKNLSPGSNFNIYKSQDYSSYSPIGKIAKKIKINE